MFMEFTPCVYVLGSFYLRLRVSTFSIFTCNYSIKQIHVDDRIFGKCTSPSTIGLGHGLDHPVSSLQYSSLYAIKVAKQWQIRSVLAY